MRRGMLTGGFVLVVVAIVIFAVGRTRPNGTWTAVGPALVSATASAARVLDARVSPQPTRPPAAPRRPPRIAATARPRPARHAIAHATPRPAPGRHALRPTTAPAGLPRLRAALPAPRGHAPAEVAVRDLTVTGRTGAPPSQTPIPEPRASLPPVAPRLIERAELEAAARYIYSVSSVETPSTFPSDIESIAGPKQTIVVVVTSGPDDSIKDRYVLGRDATGFTILSREMGPRPTPVPTPSPPPPVRRR